MLFLNDCGSLAYFMLYTYFHTMSHFSQADYGIPYYPMLLIVALINVHIPYGRGFPVAVDSYLGVSV